MNNQEAIVYLEGQWDCMCSEDCKIYTGHKDCPQGFICNDGQALQMAISALQAQDVPDINVGDKIRQVRDTIRSAQLWIPCTPETMPLPNERCILLYSNGKISGGEYDYGNENFIVDFPDNDRAVRVAKWMPDPSEHEEGDTNEHHM